MDNDWGAGSPPELELVSFQDPCCPRKAEGGPPVVGAVKAGKAGARVETRAGPRGSVAWHPKCPARGSGNPEFQTR